MMKSISFRTISGESITTKPRRFINTTSHSHSSLKLGFRTTSKCTSTLLFFNQIKYNVACKSSRGSFSHSFNNSGSRNGDDEDEDYVEAVVLFPETVRHFRMLKRGFQEETIWNSPAQLVPFSIEGRDPRSEVSLVGPGFLRQFQSPTIFLKVSCDGDFLLPIIVGEYAVEKLIESLHEDATGERPNQFQPARNLVEKLGYEVKMIKITERVVNTYFARIIFHKPGEQEILSVDASDAINLARRCMFRSEFESKLLSILRFLFSDNGDNVLILVLHKEAMELLQSGGPRHHCPSRTLPLQPLEAILQSI